MEDRADPDVWSFDASLERALRSKAKAGDSGNYRRQMESVVSNWAAFTRERGVDDVRDVTPEDVTRWVEHLRRRVDARHADDEDGISPATAWRYYSVVRAFLTYCVERGPLVENPAADPVVERAMPDRPARRSGDQQFWHPDERTRLVRYADRAADRALDGDADALPALRDRALVYVVGYSGVRGAEVLGDPNDARRDGLTWDDVDFGTNRLVVFSKSQKVDDRQLPPRTHGPLRRLKRVLAPADDDWPVFPTLHAPSLYRAARDGVDGDVEAALADADSPLDVLREFGVAPPSLTTEGGRNVLRRLCDGDHADVTPAGKHDYLTLHGGRRGVGEAMYRKLGPGSAADALGHADPKTTAEMYAHIETEDLGREAERVFDELDG